MTPASGGYPSSGGRRTFQLSRLRAQIKPFRLYWVATVGSTNDYAARLRRKEKLYAPALVLTGRQTAGRGRGGNSWWSSAGVLTATFVLPIHDRLPPQELPLIAGLAVRDAAASVTGDAPIALKWPNDVLHEGRKLAGLLCERIDNSDMVGIGLNVNFAPDDVPPPLRDQVTSLQRIAAQPLDINDVLIVLATQLHHQVRRRMEQPFSAFVREYSHHDALIGKHVSVMSGGQNETVSGKCEGVDAMGRLMIRQRGVLQRIVAGQVLAKLR